MKTDSRAGHKVHFGIFELDLDTRELSRNHSKLKLHGQPIDLLEVLLAEPGKLVTREELQKRLWPANTFVDFEHILNNNIKRLRKALDDDANAPRYIETLPRLGYRFIGPLDEAWSSTEPVTARSEPVAVLPKATITDKGRLRRWALPVAILAITFVCAAWYLTRAPHPPRIDGEYVQITHDGFRKELAGTDGVRLYLNQSLNQQSIAEISISGGQLRQLLVALPNPTVFDVSPGGASLLVYSVDRPNQKMGLWTVSVPGGTLRHLADGEVSAATWSPDGESLAYCADQAVYVGRSDGSQAYRINTFTDWLFDLAWSPDGRKIRFRRYQDWKIWEMSPDGSGLHPVFPNWNPSSTQCCGRWTPDGRFYIFASWIYRWGAFGIEAPLQLWAMDERRGVLRRAASEPIQLTSGPIRWTSPVPGKDGKTIFARGTILHGELTIYDSKTRQFQPFLGGISAQDVAFSPDGKSLVYVSFPEGVLWRANRDGTNPVQLTDPPLYPIAPLWSPDGARILFCSPDLNGRMKSYTVSVQTGAPRLILPKDKDEEWAPSWSPDGQKIVFQNSALQILDLATQQISTVPESSNMNAPRWSPDGRYIAAAFGQYFDLKVFDLRTKRWSLLKKGNAFPTWRRDSKFVYFTRLDGDAAGIYRIRVSGGEAERVVDLRGFRSTGVYLGWMGFDPDDKPLLLRDKGTSDIYALTLETK
jgi:Tol biopolymer transport system component/DNA-binding winged helix-turn-helix (wHTH) protein